MAGENGERDRDREAAEADRTKQKVGNMGTGNTPHGTSHTGGKGGKP